VSSLCQQFPSSSSTISIMSASTTATGPRKPSGHRSPALGTGTRLPGCRGDDRLHPATLLTRLLRRPSLRVRTRAHRQRQPARMFKELQVLTAANLENHHHRRARDRRCASSWQRQTPRIRGYVGIDGQDAKRVTARAVECAAWITQRPEPFSGSCSGPARTGPAVRADRVEAPRGGRFCCLGTVRMKDAKVQIAEECVNQRISREECPTFRSHSASLVRNPGQ
jgi:hypothetical protein